MDDRNIFTKVYHDSWWGKGSGPGSTPDFTASYRTALENFLRANDIKSVIDIGCGDWQFSRLIDWHGASYLGYDVVPTLIQENKRRFEQGNVRFLDMPKDYSEIDTADLALCKDVLQHLSLAHAERLLSALEHRAKYVLITNCVHPASNLNIAIGDGGWRPLDISLPPFSRRSVNLTAFHSKKAQLLVRNSN
jgi:SAM-dependent methyltransferase